MGATPQNQLFKKFWTIFQDLRTTLFSISKKNFFHSTLSSNNYHTIECYHVSSSRYIGMVNLEFMVRTTAEFSVTSSRIRFHFGNGHTITQYKTLLAAKPSFLLVQSSQGMNNFDITFASTIDYSFLPFNVHF